MNVLNIYICYQNIYGLNSYFNALFVIVALLTINIRNENSEASIISFTNVFKCLKFQVKV